MEPVDGHGRSQWRRGGSKWNSGGLKTRSRRFDHFDEERDPDANSRSPFQ
jgi:hypothetical protein